MKTNDLRGAARLAADATAGLTDLVEAMHESIARLPGGGAPLDGRTNGITGLVYQSIRGVTRVVGGSVDALLALIAPALAADAPAAPPRREREAVVAVLNGVLGDHLAASGNPLAITMALRSIGLALPLEREALAARLPDAQPTLVVLLHGLCMNDLQWQRNGHDHGAMLAQALDATPIYLHYNTGLPIAENGRQFAGLMARLLAAWPVPLQRVVLLTHSMGGLVARSALQQAAAGGQAWPAQVDDLVFLGTPHHGAPLERAGHGVDLLLGAAPYAAPLARLGRVRSAGITDLRHGLSGPHHTPLPLPAGPRCWAVAATLGEGKGALKGRLFGDGLVPVDSALGHHRDAAHTLAFPSDRQFVVHQTGHLDLLDSPEVAQRLQYWLSCGASRAGATPAAPAPA
ncbi:MAG: alpha/beta hydrolase [Betaproteobacteria bacterium]|nr:alpha/beta hydrolase [Betaproteobacteria bacterium]